MDSKSTIIASLIFVTGITVIYYSTRDTPVSNKSDNTALKDKQIIKKADKIVEHTQIAQKKIVVKPIIKEKNTQTKKSMSVAIKIDNITSNKEAKEYLSQHSLKNISTSQDSTGETPRYSVYSDISMKEAKKRRNKFVPPSAPTVVQGSFPSGEPYSVIIDSDLKSQAKDIVISNNQADGTITELAKVPVSNKQVSDTQENNGDSSLIAPPSIGQ